MAVIMSRQIVLPDRTKFVNYLQATGTQYIDTGYKPNSNTTIEVKYNSLTTSNTIGCVIGSDAGWLSNECSIYLNVFAFGTKSTSLSTATAKDVTVKLDKGTAYRDGTQVWTNSETFTSSYALTLFALNRSGSVQEFFSGRIYSAKIWDNGNLVRDFVPCIDSNGAACFYDNVSGAFYYNAGTGEFGAG